MSSTLETNSDTRISGATPQGRALDSLSRCASDMMRRTHNGSPPDPAKIHRALTPVAAILRSDPDPLLWLLYGRSPGVYVYRRAVGSAILSALFGITLGFDDDAVLDLATGGLLLDIGKATVPVPILVQTRPLNTAELEYVRRHASDGYASARMVRGIPSRVLDMIRSHHERLDGSGYPRRLRGTEIPLFARIAAIVDTYDALTLDRGYAAAMSLHAAIEYLSALRDAKFDAALVAEFHRAVGRYPTGTWVAMESGHHAVVFRQPGHAGGNGQVLLAIDPAGQALDIPNLVERGSGDEIVRALHPGTHRLEVDQADKVLAESL